VAKVRFSRSARADIARILATSLARWGAEGRRRYEALLATTIRQVAANPEGPLTRRRPDLPGDVRSFHFRHAIVTASDKVRAPAHVVYYRAARGDLIEVVAVLHDRMDPALHLSPEDAAPKDPK
jgi:toxin ParE1/3/4